MIRIDGNGLAGRAVHRVLKNKGIDACLCGDSGPSGQVVLINRETLELIREVFDICDVARCGWTVPGRIVQRPESEPLRVAAPSMAVRLDDLLSILPPPAKGADGIDEPAFSIDATGRAAIHVRQWPDQRMFVYGQRVMLITEMQGRLDDAIMELTRSSWVFAFPVAQDRVLVQAMISRPPSDPMAALCEALGSCQLVGRYLNMALVHSVATAPAAPQMPGRISDRNALAVGAAAFAMDPICGDGVGAVFRSAILAGATCAQMAGEPPERPLCHFENRHRRAFSAHLEQVTQYYVGLTRDPRWSTELRSTYAAVQQMRNAGHSDLYYTLRDGALEPISRTENAHA